MRVAAYQAPLLPSGSMEALSLIRARVAWCEAQGVAILCCPEAILGGLADYGARPSDFALSAMGGELDAAASMLASKSVTTILGFTESDAHRFYDSVAIFQNGRVSGIVRKLYPAAHRSVYKAGSEVRVFTAGTLTFGVLIGHDANYFEPARLMAAKGAAALFVPTNSSNRHARARPESVAHTRNVGIARAVENSVWIVRADVGGQSRDLVSHGSSCIIDPDGTTVESARELSEDLLIATIDDLPRERRLGWDVDRNRAVMEEYSRHLSARAAATEE
jgi:predicted amidohydrolase